MKHWTLIKGKHMKNTTREFCRICDKVVGENGVGFHMEALITKNPLGVCALCSKGLVSAYHLRKRIEETEEHISRYRVKNEENLSDEKNSVQGSSSEDEDEEMPLNKLVPLVKIEADPDASLKIENEERDENSMMEGTKPMDTSEKGDLIQCVLCDYSSHSKGNYQKHVVRVHKRQKMRCDGCKKEFHLIYLLEEHRKTKHEFNHKYVLDKKLLVEESEESESSDSDSSDSEPARRRSSKSKKKTSRMEGELIQCPLCDYQSNVKDNYQKHVIRVHKRARMKCDGCEESFHLIYLLQEHRKWEHNFTHEYVVDESLKMKKFDIKEIIQKKRPIKSSKEPSGADEQNLSNTEEKNEDGTPKRMFACPICPYTGFTRDNLRSHHRKMHDKISYSCDGCSAKFENFYKLLSHRKVNHDFDHEYIVDESLKLQDIARKEKKKIDKGKSHPCPHPGCNRFFKERRYVTKHLRMVHKIKVGGKGRPRLDPNERQTYVYPGYKVMCNHCGKFFSNVTIETHIRNKHPEERDPYICHYCGHESKTKKHLQFHFTNAHDLEIKTIRGTEATYVCQFCPKTFRFSPSRAIHEIRFHTFDYQYKCEICNKKFADKYQLKDHFKRHAEAKRPSLCCNVCGQYFTRKVLLAQHLSTHIENEEFAQNVAHLANMAALNYSKNENY
uniref:CSON015632 protein n=2 Tax=Culicoides sonorensis TaxID=179676 RepID=A0A336LX98_CULSO